MAGFYAADERRVRSRERDLGLWWRDESDGPLHRAAWIEDTGELYLVRLGPEADGGGQVELLASATDFERVQGALEGWRERCGEAQSLSWLRERLAALTLPASGESAPARPREPAPTVRLSPRTGIAAVSPDRGQALPA
jgi:hypothetical protein